MSPIRPAAPPELPPDVARRAVEWLVELQSNEATETARQSHQAWRAQHPDHERAWAHIEAVNRRLRAAAGASPLTSSMASAALAPPRRVTRRAAINTLAVFVFAGGAAWQAERQASWRAPWSDWLADERTGVGEHRSITLADGSTVALNTDTAINLRFTGTERRLRLVSGEVLISTGSDADRVGGHRPFVVETAHGELRPLGTRFAVRQQLRASRVQVFEGAVAIHPRDRVGEGEGAGRERILRAGEQARFTRSAVGDTQAASEADSAWTDGMLVASGMRLDDFLAELGRHRPGRLGCEPAIAHLRVSGTYPLASTDRVLDLLRTALPVDIHFLTRWWVTVRAARG